MVTLAHTTGHDGVQKTLVRLRSDFYIPGDRKLVQDYVRTCGVCQRNKTPTTQVIAMYLRCATDDRPRSWVDWLPWAEYCYNTSYHMALCVTPFEIVYGCPPPLLLPHQEGAAETEDADVMLRDRDAFLVKVRERLLQAQQHAKERYDEHHRDVDFAVGDWVLLQLLHAPHTHARDAGQGQASSSLCWSVPCARTHWVGGLSSTAARDYTPP